MKERNYILIYDTINSPIQNIGSLIRFYGFEVVNESNSRLRINDYASGNYHVEFYTNKIESRENKGLAHNDQKLSVISEQYLEIASEKSNNKLEFGFSRLIVQILEKNSQIYNFNIFTESEFIEFKTNYSKAVLTRYKMAKHIDENSPIYPKKEYIHNSKIIEHYKIDDVIIRSSEFENIMYSWHSIGEYLGKDGWELTASKFIPISYTSLIDDLTDLNYLQEIKDAFTFKVEPKNIIRVKKDNEREECSYLMEVGSELVFKEVTRLMY